MEPLFSKQEEQQLVEAIQKAEAHTSGEIRVHVEHHCPPDVLKEAKRVFQKLGMHRTAARNGVLILLAPERRGFAIVGDAGIDAVVPPGFWDAERDLMAGYFREGRFADGICAAVEAVGEKLKGHFPVSKEDTNELSDDISYGGKS
jgi:uncharacterized membrane protein